MAKSSRWKIFCQLKILLNMHRAHIKQEKKTCANPYTLEKFNFSIIKICRTYIWYATSSNKTMCWIYKHLESSASDKSGLFGSTNTCPSGICIFGVLYFVYSTLYWESIIDNKGTPSIRNMTRQNSRWYIYRCSWSTNCHCEWKYFHKARYSVQLFVVSIYTCLKGAHKASNSPLPIFLRVGERLSFSRMFDYWMLIMKFQINYLVFIRSMREGNFELFIKF